MFAFFKTLCDTEKVIQRSTSGACHSFIQIILRLRESVSRISLSRQHLLVFRSLGLRSHLSISWKHDKFLFNINQQQQRLDKYSEADSSIVQQWLDVNRPNRVHATLNQQVSYHLNLLFKILFFNY